MDVLVLSVTPKSSRVPFSSLEVPVRLVFHESCARAGTIEFRQATTQSRFSKWRWANERHYWEFHPNSGDDSRLADA